MEIFNYYSKKDKLMSKWGNLIKEKVSKNNIELDKYLTLLIENGEKYYGHDFVYDLSRENPKNEKFVDKFIDELTLKMDYASPERDVLISRISRAINYPTQRIAQVVDKPAQDLLSVIAQVKEKKEKSEILDTKVEQPMIEGFEKAMEDADKKENIEEKTEVVEVEETNALTKNKEPQTEEDISYSKYGDPIIDFELDEPVIKTLEPKVDEPRQTLEPNKLRKGKRKGPNKSLLKKLKGKFDDLSFRKKVLVSVVVIAGLGIATAAVISQIMNGNVDMVTFSNTLTGVIDNVSIDGLQAAVDQANTAIFPEVIDYSAIQEGHTIYTNAYDAASGTNQLVANEWVQSVPHDVYDVVNHEYLNLTQEQLNDPSFMKDLMANENYSLLVGDGQEASGFISNEDFMKMISSGREI